MSAVSEIRFHPAPVRLARLGVWAGAFGAMVLFGYIQFALPPQHLLSEYVHTSGGLEPFVAGVLALSLAAAALARILEPLGALPAWLLRLAGVALVLTAAFPTDEARWVNLTLAGQIHRYAALVAFVLVPLAGALALRGQRGAVVRLARIQVLTATGALLLLLVLHPVSPVGANLGQIGQVGEAIMERIVAAAVVGVILALSWLRPVPAQVSLRRAR